MASRRAARRGLAGVVFDMDGVIVDSERQWRLAEDSFLKGVLERWSDSDGERIVGLGAADLYALLARDYGLRLTRAQFLDWAARAGADVYRRRVSLEPGARGLLDALRAAGVPVALASSSPREWIGMVLERFGLGLAFDAVVGFEDSGGEGKPSPAIHREAARRLGADCRRCAAIEDSAVGVLAARRAGMAVVGLRTLANDRQDLSAAHLVCGGLASLNPGILQGLVQASAGRGRLPAVPWGAPATWSRPGPCRRGRPPNATRTRP